MDLGLVAKKLKHCQYKNKREFANDLYLIYENCLAYNTNPGSEFRKHAIAMKRKTDRLLSRVPEISIKERSEQIHHQEHEELDETDDDERTRERSMTFESIDEIATHHPHYGGKHPQKGTPLKPLTELEHEEIEISSNNELETDKGELQNRKWREITKRTRAKLTTDIEKQYQFEFGNRYALHRSSVDMERFSMLEHLHHQPECTKRLIRCSRTAFLRWIDRNEGASVYDTFDLNSEDEEGFDGGFFSSSLMAANRKCEKPVPTDEDDALRTDLFLPEYYLASGLPEIEGVPEEYLVSDHGDDDDDEEEEDALPSLDLYPATQPDPHGLLASMDHNIELMQQNRSIYNKCMNIRSNTPISTHIPPTESPSPHMMDTGTPIPTQVPEQPMVMNHQATDQMLQRTLSQILQHAGFESAHGTALNVLTELMSEYLLNIGKTARKYLDQYGNIMSGEDILLHTLNENNCENVSTLESYVTDDIQKFGNRLVETRRKLESTYQELVTVSLWFFNKKKTRKRESN